MLLVSVGVSKSYYKVALSFWKTRYHVAAPNIQVVLVNYL